MSTLVALPTVVLLGAELTPASIPGVIGVLVGGPIAAGLCFRAARAVEGREKSAWRLFGTAYALEALAIFVVGFEFLSHGADLPLVSLADLFWLPFYPVVVAAVIALASPSRGLVCATALLDALILTVGTGALLWELAESSGAVQGSASSAPGILVLAYLIGDLFLLFSAVSLGLSQGRHRLSGPVALLTGSFVVGVAVDASLLWTTMEEAPAVFDDGSPFWLMAPVLVGAAALSRMGWWSGRHAVQSAEVQAPDGGGLVAAATSGRLSRRVRATMPYIAFPLAGSFMYLHLVRMPEADPTESMVAVGVSLAMLGLLSLRQYLTMRDNQRLSVSLADLSQGLEGRVERRTAELAEQSRVLAARTEQLTTLNEVASSLSHALTADQVLTTGLTLSFEGTGCSSGAVWLRDPDGSVRMAARYGLGPELEQVFQRLPEEEQSFGRVLSTESGIMLRSDTCEMLLRLAAPCGMGVWGVYLVPLVSRGLVLGAMGLLVNDADGFGPVKRQLERSIASQLGVALENAQQYDRARFLADHDPVSGLLNHRALHARLDEEFNRAQRTGGRFSLLMVDLDNFKLFNDTYGHPFGDTVLLRVAEVLRDTVRGSDVICRYGGDEFVAILPDTDGAGAVDVAERLQGTLYETPFMAPDGQPVPLLCSVGVATYPDDARRADELVAFADRNLYTSKQHGGGTITASPPAERVETQGAGVFTMLDGLITAVDNKDRYTRSHSDGVTDLALALAARVGLADESRLALRLAGLLHDVGKIGVPDRILRKPGRLTAEEYEVVKQHAALSELMIKEIPHLDQVVTAVGSHHERFDGGGYPRGLKGEGIPLLGRILAVADAYSAMTTDRPYRKALTLEDARADLKRAAGTQLDPGLVDAFMAVLAEREPGDGGAQAAGADSPADGGEPEAKGARAG